jgi:hypothetical protein
MAREKIVTVAVREGEQAVPYITGWHRPCGVAVLDLTTRKAMRRVAGKPQASGEYAADEETAVFTFAAEDAGHQVCFLPESDDPRHAMKLLGYLPEE